MSELEIPERAYTAIRRVDRSIDSSLEIVAPVIVAAAYRKRAGKCPCDDCDALRSDADQLDPEGKTL